MELWLVPGVQPNTRVPRPAACPHAGCGGRRVRLLQVVAKPVRDVRVDGVLTGVAVRTVTVHRYVCRGCGRTFRVYPAGVDRGDVAVGVKRFAAALRLLGLSYRDVSRALAVLGVALGKSQVQAAVAPRMRGLGHRSASMAPLLERVVVADEGRRGMVGGGGGRDGGGRHDGGGRQDGGGDGGGGGGGGGDSGGDLAIAATVRVRGRDLTLRRAVDGRGRAALVIDDIDRGCRLAVERWVRATLAGLGVDVEVVFPAARCLWRPALEAEGAVEEVGNGVVAGMEDGVVDVGDGTAGLGGTRRERLRAVRVWRRPPCQSRDLARSDVCGCECGSRRIPADRGDRWRAGFGWPRVPIGVGSRCSALSGSTRGPVCVVDGVR